MQNGWRESFISKYLVVRHVTWPCRCMTTLVVIKITHVISMWTPSPHWITVSCHAVESPKTTVYYCAIFLFCGGGKKRKDDKKKTKALYDRATTGIPVITFPIFEYMLKTSGTTTKVLNCLKIPLTSMYVLRTSSPGSRPRLVSYPFEEALLQPVLTSFIKFLFSIMKGRKIN